ncbi:hypothetical protein MVES1_002713 [Malassezia vespertilionis]|uniref:BZIP domain-containing protein n=1 Tax=Malassezia vespertilionis TaxID=2020962 RepID=A0A2N1J9Y1_9BASI|nr:uncharacterized protein MVES1_002713 [Malassezia vespertilionis]PKI83360.1 hypothetical protein MVES_002563 [Malassezia vespertilionis]WFD07350.1 hypothetical protein MVES1_002713 [Malassezia vespertilionis]
MSRTQDSISFILGLNQLDDVSDTGPIETTESNELLAGLNMMPPATSETREDTVSNFTNQLSLWTNASFSFDGPMGHALIGDEEKKEDLDKPNEAALRDEHEERMQRYFAASSAYSNAARDKNRDRELDAMNPSGPGNALPQPAFHERLETPAAHAPLHASNREARPIPAPLQSFASTSQQVPTPPNGGPWDLTSTLALQYLLSRNPSMLGNIPQLQNGAPAPVPVPAPGGPVDVGIGAAWGQAQPTVRDVPEMLPAQRPKLNTPTKNAEEARVPWGNAVSPKAVKKRRSSLAMRDKEEQAANADYEMLKDAEGGAQDRIRLVDTGNIEADAEVNRQAIEEDKRRRNTLASARFRVKKKQREAALEISARELEGQVAELRQENERLRTENEWLRRLVNARPEGLSALLGANMNPAPPLE